MKQATESQPTNPAICNKVQMVHLSPKVAHFHMFGKVLHTQ